MNLDFVAHRMKEDGWKHDGRRVFAGERFDLVSSRRYRFEPWMVLVKAVPVLDIFLLNKLQMQLELIFIRSKNELWKRNLYLYLVAGKVTQQAVHALKMDSMRLLRFSQKGTGTRKILVVDEAGRQIHGPYPQLMEFEQEAPFDLRPFFMQAFSPDGAAYPLPAVHDDVAALIDHLRPASALGLIKDNQRPDLGVYRVEALRELGRIREADECLDALLPRLQGDELGRAQRFKANHLFGQGQVDEGMLLLEQAASHTHNANIRAAIISAKANGYAIKRCFNLAENAIREALQVAPDEPRVMFAQATLSMQMDQRLEGRAIMERMPGDTQAWVNSYIDLELANIAILLGEFDEAKRLASSALDYSDEIIHPLVFLVGIAMLKGDLQEMERLVSQIEARSPQTDLLPPIRAGLESLRKRLTGQTKAPQRRLESFPSLVQRRDYCGPCTIELVLRYWKGGLDLTNSDIARRVKLPQAGTPIHRMTEFFRLLGFNTLRCIAPPDMLKKLVDAGFPVIVEEEAAGQSHVTVVIGYDDEAGTIELQDPMTHHVLPIPIADFNRFRQIHFDSAIVAYPAHGGHEETLARLGLISDEVLALLDQASVAIETGNLPLVAELMERATQIRPQHGLAWARWLQALLQQWRVAQDRLRSFPAQLSLLENHETAPDMQKLRSQFYSVLERARLAQPQAEFIYLYEGYAALLDGDLPPALDAFQKAHELAPGNPNSLAAIAECQYNLRQVEQALESARQAVKLDPGSVAGNVWLARCLSWLRKEHADYYAHVGLDLTPDWWMAHLAMAEAHMSRNPAIAAQPETRPGSQPNPGQAAWHEIDIVLSHFPNQPDALVLRAYLMMGYRDFISAQAVLETALEAELKDGHSPNPMTVHMVYQTLCRLFFSSDQLDQAAQQVLKMLEREPTDPWALQFQAAVGFRRLIYNKQSSAGTGVPDEDYGPARELYLAAIQANQGEPAVVSEFLSYLLQLDKKSEAVELSGRLREQFPDQPNLAYHHGAMLNITGQAKPAADAMLDALSKENGIRPPGELSYAFGTILQGRGLELGELEILRTNLPKGITTRERDRALGLSLSFYPKEKGGRARQLLEDILADDPEDAEVILRLGYVAVSSEECERLFHQAVMLAPHWTLARVVLVDYLLRQGRYQEALDFTTGHEGESLGLLSQHVISLNMTGRYEEAAPAAEKLIYDMRLPGERISQYYHWKSDADTNSGEYGRALATIRQAQQLFPKELDWYYLESFTLCSLGQIAEAKAALAAGKEKGMDEGLVQSGDYWIALAQGDLETALELADQREDAEWENMSKQKAPGAKMLGEWGRRYLGLLADLGNMKEAEKYLINIAKQSHVWADAALELSKTRANRLTLKCAEQALKDNKKTALTQYRALLARAIASRNLDDPKARQYFDEIRDKFPSQGGAFEQLALYAALDGNVDQAAILAEQAVAQGRASWTAWGVRGLVHFLKDEREAAAMDLKKGWNRTIAERFADFPLWWLHFVLAGDQSDAEAWKVKAYAQAQSSFDRNLLELIQAQMG
jgi:Tfp pilus assembly protein PilF